MSNDLRFNGPCSRCGNLLGEMSFDEFRFLFDVDGPEALCFDCDSHAADSKPLFFWDWWNCETIKIGDTVFDVKVNDEFKHRLVQSRAHERERARGLSSYTNLNRNSKNQALLGNGLVVSVCTVCAGTGDMFAKQIRVDCGYCAGLGYVEEAIVIPAWILGLGCENV